ncbi:hypothetical protein [Hymenobacter elongatus]|uniref:Uncharacterized protein n=1 Tax=Hymenobacter elongatus TaxID=877208 RepID=A0A4Z0PLC5_9BACT|nr:hypothetical protein [Hymenobacter elongatus]TGE15996.1 hypothetical protein E5J99_11240 [Hymenobacter elongatus]
MMLFIEANQPYPHRPLPLAPYLREEPRAAMAALEAAIRACPPKDTTAYSSRPTPTQRYELSVLLDSSFLTHREAVWLELWRYEFDTATAAKVLTQLPLILGHRQASGIAPVAQKGGCFFPERLTPPQP